MWIHRELPTVRSRNFLPLLIPRAGASERVRMKPAFVADLKPDTTVTSFLLVSEKELRSTREGKSFLRLELSDRTGAVEARLWENAEVVSAAFGQDDIVKVQARVESYRNKLQLSVDRLRRADPGD